MVNQIAVIEKTNPIRLTLSQQFTLQVCDTVKRHVWCCRDGEQATNSELKQLDEKEILSSGKLIQGRLRISTEHSTLILLISIPFEVAQQNFQHFYN